MCIIKSQPINSSSLMYETHYFIVAHNTTIQVNPLYDHGGVTSLMAANLLYEMLSVLPGVKYQNTKLKFTNEEDLI